MLRYLLLSLILFLPGPVVSAHAQLPDSTSPQLHTSPDRQITTSPYNKVTTSLNRHITKSPYYKVTTSLNRHITKSQNNSSLSGTVTDTRGNPIPGANVYLVDTFDGTSTDEKGRFRFTTEEQGRQRLEITAIGFATRSMTIDLDQQSAPLKIVLEEKPMELEELQITAGLFEAGDRKKSVVLNPADIVTTAGATADIPGVMNTLPGTQVVGEQGRLFVRGGTGRETKNFIDGMLAADAYSLSPENIPSRMRFSPFLFSGTAFSTGGYSAEYGQALSGTLILETDDEPEQTQTDLSLMSVGGGVAQTWKGESRSLFVETSYSNLTPYFRLVPQRKDWEKAPRSWQNTLMLRNRVGGKGNLKIFYTNDLSSMSLRQPSFLDVNDTLPVTLDNTYHLVNANYDSRLNDRWKIYSGVSGTWVDNSGDMTVFASRDRSQILHWKSWAYYDTGGKTGFKFGTDQYLVRHEAGLDFSGDSLHANHSHTGNSPFNHSHTDSLRSYNFYTGSLRFDNAWADWLPAVFVEADIDIADNLVARTGLRTGYSSLSRQPSVSPRFSLAYRTGEHSQVSLASGWYTQRPQREYLAVNERLIDEKAFHAIINYQWSWGRRTFRLELYHKQYLDLVTFADRYSFEPASYSNSGSGYARGADVFWRDSESIPYMDYWISYSFMDTERLYRDFPVKSIPGYASEHNFSVVTKYFVPALRSQFGLSYRFASGRHYDDPNREGFNEGITPAYHDLSMNWSFLVRTNFIVHFSVTNLPGRDHVFGYMYSEVPGEDGRYDGAPVRMEAKRFLFLGVFFTLSKDNTTNQLRNL